MRTGVNNINENTMRFSNKLSALQKEITTFLNSKVALSTEESVHRYAKCIRIDTTNERKYLSGSQYLHEIIDNRFLDNNGYEYDFGVLDINDLCEVADSLK